ncbi:MAG: flagellar M-ring protein FliF, partial [Gemmatimonadaceae bacterium]|nr:flagellar M-ring protein FliF [Gemmatimonadaceae bacterium]
MPPALLSLFDRVGGPRRALILLVGLAAAAGLFGLARWAGAPAWVPAFSDVALSDVGAVTDRLTQAGIDYRLGGSGTTILVQETDVAKARVALARAGVLPEDQRPGYDKIFGGEQPFGPTEEVQRINERRALEGELERTISSMRGIKRARVSLVMPQPESYGAVAPPAEASVVLEARAMDGITDEVVKGIARHVAASVPGLTSDHVTILDDAGRALSIGDEPESPTALTNRQLEHQIEIERSLRDKVERLLVPVLGAGNARVQVNATVSFDRVERTSQTVDPEKQAVSSERKSELIPGADGGAGRTEIANEYVNTTATEAVSSAVGAVKRLSVAVLLAAPRPPAPDSAALAA